MTAIMPGRPAFDRDELRADLIAVLAAHGLTDTASVTMNVTEIEQGGAFAGVSISGMVYERPAHLPPADECEPVERDAFAGAIEQAEAIA